MTTQKQLPEESYVEPEILSPEEEAERARKAVEESARLDAEGDPLSLADPDNPLRMPGELSTRPRAVTDRNRARRP